MPWYVLGGVNVAKKFLFLDPSKRSFPLNVFNPTSDILEAWIDIKFGYVTSDDSGSAKIFYDSTGTPPQSAAGWINIYPQRFKLAPQESQIIRITASPPANIPDGEYWARFLIASQPVKLSLDQQKKKQSGYMFVEQVGLPFHYRKGNVSTGLEIKEFTAEASEKKIEVSLDMQRTGNSSYWGTATFRLYDNEQRRVLNVTKDVVVYTAFKANYSIDRKGIPPGQYTLLVDLKTEGRHDVRKNDIIQASPIQLTKTLTIY